MIDIKLLNQSEYTFSEIAKILGIHTRRVELDFKKKMFKAVMKKPKRTYCINSVGDHAIKMVARVPTRYVSKSEFLKYRKYIKIFYAGR